MSAAARFGAALAMLWTAHDVADHVVQTDAQAAGKSSDWRAMAGHVGSYTAVQVLALAALRPLGVRPSPGRLALAAAWSAGTHAFLDRRWPVLRALETTGSPGFARPEVRTWHLPDPDPNMPDGCGQLPLHGPYLADQALHHGCLAVAALILAAGGRP